jgi:hypothetical protein
VKRRNLKAKKKDREINRDISIAVDIILKGLEPIEDVTSRLDRIEALLAMQIESEKAIIINIH